MQEIATRSFEVNSVSSTPEKSLITKDLVVFSHLRWEFVTQRPQHILSRFAQDRKVLFVEEPLDCNDSDRGTAHIIQINDNITVIQPCIDWENMIQELQPVVEHYIQRLNIHQPLLWFYSAVFHEITERIPHSFVVYDCMDELSAFKFASPALIEQEKQLIQKADVVFTGGKSLYEAKRKIADHVYCYPSSVDRAHFEKALQAETQIPADITDIPRPIVAYYGVIDERMDLPLLDDIARLRPNVSFVLIGPVVKIGEHELPRHPNLHYLGGRHYNDLPAYLKAFDIAMMPFALNESTQFISPTKTLEYIAGHKPIISTPIYDVKRDYSEVLAVVNDAEEFVQAIDRYLQENETDKQARIKHYEAILRTISWDATVVGMQKNIVEHARANVLA
jgi:glycosyltransferase involved in cell wall biosynthesis